MRSFLLNANHLSAYLDHLQPIAARIDGHLRRRDRFGITLPVLCEYRAGIVQGRRLQRNLARLRSAKQFLRFWPLDQQTAVEFGLLSQQLRAIGRMLAPFDCLIASGALQYGCTLLTADEDFQGVPGVRVENWLV